MRKPKHDYHLIELRNQYKHRSERLEAARGLGFDTIGESIVKTYRKTGSARRTGQLNGDLSSTAILRFLKKVGEPIIDQRRSTG